MISSIRELGRAIGLLCLLPAAFALLAIAAPVTTNPVVLFGGFAKDLQPNWLAGFSTVDPNQGYTSFALGYRAALDVLAGHLPLWNPYEGLGSPLLGEMQSAALFPPTLLLLLPHGQVIEHALLQIVAGLGTFLFLRRFGLGATASLAGGILFEFNGVFAWLRNAIYNPVALLPWLFWAAESLFVQWRYKEDWRLRVRVISRGAIAAALALYAGFPEVVYLYCLPLFAWIALRTSSLGWRSAIGYLRDLALLGSSGLILAAPLLIAFGHFLVEGNVGDHQGAGFKEAVLPASAMVTYLLPYLYGPISSSADPVVAAFWSVGGYLGVMPCLLAIGGLLLAWRQATTWLLAAWISFAVAISHGAPYLLDVFRHVPLVTITMFARYLDAGWLFCAVVLGAVFIDRLRGLSRQQRGLIVTAAVILVLLLVASTCWMARATLIPWWQPHGGHRAFIIASMAGAVLLLMATIVSGWRRRPESVTISLVCLASIEAVVLFALPYASSPRNGALDVELVSFLRERVGLQRIAMAFGTGLMPNIGSALGIATINYDDTPIPDRTVHYVQRKLDLDAVPIMFRPNVLWKQRTPAQQRDTFLAMASGYAQAGVRYVLAPADFFSTGLLLASTGTRAVSLGAGQSITLRITPRRHLNTIGAVSILIGTFGRKSDGRLRIELCQAERCQSVEAALETAADNKPLRVPISPAFDVGAMPFQLKFSKLNGSHDVAFWSSPPTTSEDTDGVGPSALVGVLPHVTFEGDGQVQPVLQAATTTVFELAEAQPYASAPGCRLQAQSREQISTQCDSPTRLTRLEVFMNGWIARVNGSVVPIDLVDDTFQSVILPAGQSTIEFDYKPAGVRPAILVASLNLLFMIILQRAPMRGRRK